MTTDTQPMAPTDAEIVELMRDGCNCRYNDEADHINFARAVLARWGQPAHSGEPVAWLDPWTGTKVTTDYDAYGKHGIPLYTAPQPMEPVATVGSWTNGSYSRNYRITWHRDVPTGTQLYTAPQPVARAPLTDEQAISLCKMGPVHAPDGQVVRTPEQYRRELEDAKFAGIRKAERAHGIT